MSKYQTECKVAVKSLNALCKLPADSIAYDTQLIMLERHMPKVRASKPAVPSAEHLLVQSFLDSPETRERLRSARVRIREATTGRDRKAVLKANLQLLSFRRKARWAKSVGVGYGQMHTKVGGGAPDSNRRRH